jgi:hypothetical protein
MGQDPLPMFRQKKFKTKEGYINEKSKIGHCIVEDDASTLNRILVKELIRAGGRQFLFNLQHLFFVQKEKSNLSF